MIPIYLGLWAVYLGLSFVAVRKYFRHSKNQPAVTRLFGRSFVLGLCWGLAGVGGQGFGLPAPPVIALFIQVLAGAEWWFYAAFVPFLWSWLFYFVVYLVAMGFKQRAIAIGTWDEKEPNSQRVRTPKDGARHKQRRSR